MSGAGASRTLPGATARGGLRIGQVVRVHQADSPYHGMEGHVAFHLVDVSGVRLTLTGEVQTFPRGWLVPVDGASQ